MNDMSAVIIPKSDQINADDLIAGPLTIRINDVKISPGTEQPVSIFYDGDNGKPWRPCKSMSRVLVAVWGPDAKAYVGRSVTLYRDPKVKWGGLEVGGIRISHMSDLETATTMALTETRANRKPFTVRPLQVAAPANDDPAAKWAAGFLAKLATLAPSAARQYADEKATRLAELRVKRPELAADIDMALAELSDAPPPTSAGHPLSGADADPSTAAVDEAEQPLQEGRADEDYGEFTEDELNAAATAKADELISKSKRCVDKAGLTRIIGNAQADLAAMDDENRARVEAAFEAAEARLA